MAPVSNPDGPSDEALAAAASAGDGRALEALLARHLDRVHSICRRVLGNPQDALDATQEALLLVSRRIDRYDERARFTTWLYRVATNAAIDEARRRSRRALPSEQLADVASAERVDEDVSTRLDVDAALAELTPDYRAAVALRDLADLDYAQIAEILEIPPGTVRSRIARGRAALADAIGNQSERSERQISEER